MKKKKGKGNKNNNNTTTNQNGGVSSPVKTDNTVSDKFNKDTFGEIVKIKEGDGTSSITAIVSGLFSMEDDISKYKGRIVISTTTQDEEGVVDGSFGKMGKCKVLFKDGLSADVGSPVKMLGAS